MNKKKHLASFRKALCYLSRGSAIHVFLVYNNTCDCFLFLYFRRILFYSWPLLVAHYPLLCLALLTICIYTIYGMSKSFKPFPRLGKNVVRSLWHGTHVGVLLLHRCRFNANPSQSPLVVQLSSTKNIANCSLLWYSSLSSVHTCMERTVRAYLVFVAWGTSGVIATPPMPF